MPLSYGNALSRIAPPLTTINEGARKGKKARQGGEERKVRGDDGIGKKGKDGKETGKENKQQKTRHREGEIEEARWEEDCQRRGLWNGKGGKTKIEAGSGTMREKENVRDVSITLGPVYVCLYGSCCRFLIVVRRVCEGERAKEGMDRCGPMNYGPWPTVCMCTDRVAVCPSITTTPVLPHLIIVDNRLI